MPHGRAHTVGPRISAADDDHVPVFGRDVIAVPVPGVQQASGVEGEELHREVDALEVPALHRQVARFGGAAAEHHGVEFLDELRGGEVLSDLRAGDEFDALCGHQVDAALHDGLVQFHVGDAVHQQAADAVGAFVYGHGVAGAVELRRAGEPGGAGAHHGDPLARALFGGLRDHPAPLESPVDDGAFDIFDGDRRIVEAQHARPLAGRRTDPAGELGEVVGPVQAIQRLPPEPPVDQVVPLGDQVVDGAPRGQAVEQDAGVAEGDAAVHAARPLFSERFLREVQVKLLPVPSPLLRGPVGRHFALVVQESCGLAHSFSFYFALRIASSKFKVQSSRFPVLSSRSRGPDPACSPRMPPSPPRPRSIPSLWPARARRASACSPWASP